MDKDIQQRIDTWLNDDYDKASKDEIRLLQKEHSAELADSFYRNLEFGTGGLRGIMGVGTNRMNNYTVGFATQGLANYLLKCFPKQNIKVAISHDSRHNSRQFAEITANIISANGIKVFLFDDLRPTPELSFAVRQLRCNAGIMITASHNPKEYNGYKVYWQDGGQLVPPHDKNVIAEVNKVTTLAQVKNQPRPELIHSIGADIDEIYLDKVAKLSINPSSIRKAKQLKIVYTPLHGTGITMVPKALKKMGFQNVTILEEQATPDGDFPTVKSPNPEEKSALELALKKAREVDADLVLATDPDADRVGIAIRDMDGALRLLNGNQTGTLLIHYVLSQLQMKKKLKDDNFIVKTVVTTDLIDKIANDYNVECLNVLTGFKYIAEAIREKEGNAKFLVGGEESYGYLVDDFVRDKDAVSACCLIAEMAAHYAVTGRPGHQLLIEVLNDIYRQYGYYKEDLLSITQKGKAGMEAIQKKMDNLRKTPPKKIAFSKVVMMKDYYVGKSFDLQSGANEIIDLPSSNVLQFFMADGSKVTVRPSGTEPKIKYYFSVNTQLKKRADFHEVENELNLRLERLKNDIQE